jgi:hypothetical protein
VEDIRQWEVEDHQDIVCIEIMAKLPRGDEYIINEFLNYQVTNFVFRKYFTDEVDWLLHPEGMAFLLAFHHDSRTDDVSSRGDVE